MREKSEQGLMVTGPISGMQILSRSIPWFVQHFTLRFIPYCKGYILWNYAHFLDYATERIFLKSVAVTSSSIGCSRSISAMGVERAS